HADPGKDDRKASTEARAAALLAALVEQGAPASRVSATGFGVEQPIVPLTSRQKARNRRVEFVTTEVPAPVIAPAPAVAETPVVEAEAAVAADQPAVSAETPAVEAVPAVADSPASPETPALEAQPVVAETPASEEMPVPALDALPESEPLPLVELPLPEDL